MDTTLSLSSFRPAEKRWNWRSLHPSLILLNVFCVELVASADLRSSADLTSCTGMQRHALAESELEVAWKGKGAHVDEEPSRQMGGGFALLTIVIYTLFSVSRIDSHQEAKLV